MDPHQYYPHHDKAQRCREGTAWRLHPNCLFLEDPRWKAEEGSCWGGNVDICCLEAERGRGPSWLEYPEQGGLEG